MPENVQAFVDKYGGLGSKEQDAAFWKDFRKAANAYANIQAKRICDLEHALAEEIKHRDRIEDKMRVELSGYPDSELWGEAGLIAATMRCVDALGEVTYQQDRLAEEWQKVVTAWDLAELLDENAFEALGEVIQSLTPNEPISK